LPPTPGDGERGTSAVAAWEARRELRQAAAAYSGGAPPAVDAAARLWPTLPLPAGAQAPPPSGQPMAVATAVPVAVVLSRSAATDHNPLAVGLVAAEEFDAGRASHATAQVVSTQRNRLGARLF
jgi:hypothetical protein